jgi:hypothetical protein
MSLGYQGGRLLQSNQATWSKRMADRYDDRYEDERPPRGRSGSGRQRGRPGRYRDRTGSDEWEEREPGRHDYGWRRHRDEERDDTDVYAREDTISFRGTRTPDYSWPPLQAGPHAGRGRGVTSAQMKVYSRMRAAGLATTAGSMPVTSRYKLTLARSRLKER